MVTVPLVVWLSGCRCGTQLYDQVYLVDASAGVPLSGGDAAAASTDADTASDAAGASNVDVSLDCTAATAGCVPGAECLTACECIRDRERLGPESRVSIKKCTLLDGAGPPSVDMRYVVIFSGCGD